MMRNSWLFVLFLLSMAVPSVVSAQIALGINFPGIANDADVIVVGTVTSVESEGDTSLVLGGGHEVPAKARLATLSVDQVLKGETLGGRITIRFESPNFPYGYVSEGDFMVLFLREANGGYRFVSPQHPGIPAVSGAQGRGEDPVDRVLSLLADGLRMDASPQLKIEALEAIVGIDDPIAVEALNAVLGDPDPQVRLRAVRHLLSVGEVNVLPAAEAALADRTLDPLLLAYVLVGIEDGMAREAALPVLERLMLFPEAETRRAAARAMRRIESPLIIEPLSLALADSDFYVRLAAVQGLARALGAQTLFASIDGFRNDEQRYIEPLRSITSTLDR